MESGHAFGFLCSVFLILAYRGLALGADLTRTPGASGSEVVDAVVDLIHHACIFDDDKFFLRRLAIVESRDGYNGNTYRHGYDGGIWQVDKDKFLQTQTSYYARKYYPKILTSNLHIDWSKVTWANLRRPLYSGLAARLYIEVMNRGQNISREISEQALVWHRDYHNSNPSPTSNFTATADLLPYGCSGEKPLDAVFILDSSGSVDILDFEKAKEFVIRWIEAFNIGPDATQLAVISYSSRIRVEFDLDTYHNSSELISRVRRIPYMSGGTNTADAIRIAVDRSLSSQYGARANVPRAIILVTDGQSNDHTDTVIEAARARRMHITMFAVGVGSGVNENELNDVATDPDCTHVFLVQDFSLIEDLKQEMAEATCKTKIHLGPTSTGNDTDNGTNIVNTTCTLKKSNVCNIAWSGGDNISGIEMVFQTTVNCGSATVYAAYNNPNPGVAYYEIKSVATKDKPSVIYLDEDGRTLYISIEGHSYRLGVNNSIGDNSSVVCEAVSILKPNLKVEVLCKDNGKERKCTPADLIDFKDGLCTVSWEFPNPCTREHLLDRQLKFPHPHHIDRYLMCDFAGNVYIVQCPKGHMYNLLTQTCGLGTGTHGSINGTRVPLGADLTNPCTVEAILAGHMLFADVHDNTKYITCDVWGNAWLGDCPVGYIWDPIDMRCVVESAGHHVQSPGPLESSVPNPCTKEHIAARKMFFPYPYAQDRYIQCDVWGDAFVMLCFAGGHWNALANSCTAGNMG